MKSQVQFSLLLWVVVLLLVGFTIGSVTKPQIDSWYVCLNRSSLTPPNYVFPIAWTILYMLLGVSGWLIWSAAASSRLLMLKVLFVVQLVFNWSWTPLFFYYHLIGLSLLVINCIVALVTMMIFLAYPKNRLVSLLMLPYWVWTVFADYLNFYIWLHN